MVDAEGEEEVPEESGYLEGTGAIGPLTGLVAIICFISALAIHFSMRDTDLTAAAINVLSSHGEQRA